MEESAPRYEEWQTIDIRPVAEPGWRAVGVFVDPHEGSPVGDHKVVFPLVGWLIQERHVKQTGSPFEEWTERRVIPGYHDSTYDTHVGDPVTPLHNSIEDRAWAWFLFGPGEDIPKKAELKRRSLSILREAEHMREHFTERAKRELR